MSDNMGSRANKLMKAMLKEPKRSFGEATSSKKVRAEPIITTNDEWNNDGFSFSDEEDVDYNAALIRKKTECRICHDEDFVNNMEAPCACNGSLRLAHRKCIQKWCNEKKDTICEICHQPYVNGYTVEEEFEAVIEINSTNDPWNPNVARVLTIEEAEELLGDHFDDCATPRGFRIAIIRTLVLISGSIIMMKHAYDQVDVAEQDHGLGDIFSALQQEQVFFVRLMAIMMPIYALCWIINLAIRRSERREAAARLAARHNARVAAAAAIAQRRSTATQPQQNP